MSGFVYYVSAYDNAKLNALFIEARKTNNNALSILDVVLAKIAKGNEDINVTEMLNVLSVCKNKDCSLKQSFKSAMPLALWCMGGCLCWEMKRWVLGGIIGQSFTYKDDPSDRTWYIYDKNGNEEIITRALFITDARDAIKSSLLVAGGAWTVLGVGKYLYLRWYYKHLMEKILRTPHVIFERDKLTNL
jgi:hypothetical protein